jgi:hypothetical protein
MPYRCKFGVNVQMRVWIETSFQPFSTLSSSVADVRLAGGYLDVIFFVARLCRQLANHPGLDIPEWR